MYVCMYVCISSFINLKLHSNRRLIYESSLTSFAFSCHGISATKIAASSSTV